MGLDGAIFEIGRLRATVQQQEREILQIKTMLLTFQEQLTCIASQINVKTADTTQESEDGGKYAKLCAHATNHIC